MAPRYLVADVRRCLREAELSADQPTVRGGWRSWRIGWFGSHCGPRMKDEGNDPRDAAPTCTRYRRISREPGVVIRRSPWRDQAGAGRAIVRECASVLLLAVETCRRPPRSAGLALRRSQTRPEAGRFAFSLRDGRLACHRSALPGTMPPCGPSVKNTPPPLSPPTAFLLREVVSLACSSAACWSLVYFFSRGATSSASIHPLRRWLIPTWEAIRGRAVRYGQPGARPLPIEMVYSEICDAGSSQRPTASPASVPTFRCGSPRCPTSKPLTPSWPASCSRRSGRLPTIYRCAISKTAGASAAMRCPCARRAAGACALAAGAADVAGTGCAC